LRCQISHLCFQGGHFMRRGAKPYTPPPRTAEDDRALLNWLSMRVTGDGKRCSPDHGYDRVLVENSLRVARRLGLTVQPGVYLPRPEQPQKRRPRKAA
jgi:hypothetical protein